MSFRAKRSGVEKSQILIINEISPFRYTTVEMTFRSSLFYLTARKISTSALFQSWLLEPYTSKSYV